MHPELYSLQAEGLSLRLEQLGGALAPLEVLLSAASLEASYSEAQEDAAQFTFLQARRSEHANFSLIQGCGSALSYCGSGSGSSIFSNCGSGSRVLMTKKI